MSGGLRVAVQADIGQSVYHVGDEAIGQAAHDELTARGVAVVLLTRDAAQTRAHVGQVETGRTLQFPWAPVDRERYLGEIDRVLLGDTDALPPHDQVFELIETIRGVDAVLVAGGGNLNSRFGWLLYERAATALVAHRLGKPVAVTGQTLGPAVSGHDRGTLAELLRRCGLVGVREGDSLALARGLAPEHPGLVGGLDDAAFWPADVAPRVPEDRPRVVVSLGGGTGTVPQEQALDAVARLLDGLASRYGARLALLPHMATPGEGDGDEHLHRMLADRLTTTDVEVLTVPTASEAVRVTADADLVVATRYHPAVFACAAGVPVLALPPDHYSQVRLGGALANWGLGSWTVPLTAVAADPAVAEAVADAVWAARDRVREHLTASAPALRKWHASWWDALVAALAAGPGAAVTTPSALPAPEPLDPPAAVEAARAGVAEAHARAAAAEQEAVEAERAASVRPPEPPPVGARARRLAARVVRAFRAVRSAAGRPGR